MANLFGSGSQSMRFTSTPSTISASNQEIIRIDPISYVSSYPPVAPYAAPHASKAQKPIPESIEAPYSAFPKWQRIAYVYIASVAAFAAPVSSSIYFPAILSLAKDLNTSLTNINLTVTAFMIVQGIAPTIVGGISDRIGRRPAFIFSFTIFTVANVGLALQSNWVALLVLRCLQSCGSSGTTALSSATVSDVATRQQRGSYIGLASLGSAMGPALGPVIGGLLNHFLGWRSIFWFLTVFSGLILLLYVLMIPETCRNVVGNGSLPAQNWNRPLISYLTSRNEVSSSEKSNKHRPGILSTIPILLDKECFLLLFYGGLVYAGYYIIIIGLPEQLASAYHFNSIQVGLCYLPVGVGPLLMRPIVGRIMDKNFRRHARKLDIEIVENKQMDDNEFPFEWARLEISLVLVYLSAAAIIPYGWIMGLQHPPLAAVIILLFIQGLVIAAIFQPLTALIIDINPRSSAAATAASQFIRCLLGAGSVAVTHLMLQTLGRGWTATLVALIWVIMSLCWWIVIFKGSNWRKLSKVKRNL